MRPDPNILLAANLLYASATNVAAARAHLRHERRLVDGLPSIASGADTGGGSHGERTITIQEPCTGERRCAKLDCPEADTRHNHPCPIDKQHTHPASVPVTGVEAAMFQRQHLDERLADLDAIRNDIVTMALELGRTATDILGIRVEVLRCSSLGRDGALEWADPLCSNVPSRGKICDRCAKAEYRWRQDHGLPARVDGLFTGGAAAS